MHAAVSTDMIQSHCAINSTSRQARMQVVSRDIRRILTQRAQYFNIYLDDVSITNLTFSKEYTGAVEAKQVAQQEAERARFIVRMPCFSVYMMELQEMESYSPLQCLLM